MLKLIVGVKGTGKTKTLINMANTALDTTNGCVVVIEKGSKLTHEIKNKARLVNTEEYGINDAHMLYGLVAGTYASNYDVANVFIDSALKICENNMQEFIKFVQAADKLCAEHNIELVMTSSIPVEEVPADLKSYIA
ncbi:MAG: ATP-binding protein [Ruminococcaceae bacterium]|nr:ATP-binding protein [Oscillospiraceae bacterium]